MTLNKPGNNPFCHHRALEMQKVGKRERVVQVTAAPGEPFEGWGLHPECGPYGEYQQWHIIAAPQHAFLRATISAVMWNIDNYSIEHHGVGKPGVLRTTGPIAYTKAITPLVDR